MTKFILASALVFSFQTVSAKGEKKAAKPPVGTAPTMKIDTAKSEVTWTGKKVLVDASHTGSLKLKSGEVAYSANEIKSGQFEIDMASLKNSDLQGNPKQADLEGHLKSADFFDIAKYPTASFKITSAKTLPAGGMNTHEVTGDLTMKGETKSISFPIKVTAEGKDTVATGTMKIDRTLWNVRYGSDKFFKGLGDKVIANEVDLKLKIVATK
jgi:polyisoprenoid-binding protein YceI